MYTHYKTELPFETDYVLFLGYTSVEKVKELINEFRRRRTNRPLSSERRSETKEVIGTPYYIRSIHNWNFPSSSLRVTTCRQDIHLNIIYCLVPLGNDITVERLDVGSYLVVVYGDFFLVG